MKTAELEDWWREAHGERSGYGEWHAAFDRVYLPKGMFRTAKNGNLEHVETGEQDFRKYAVPNDKG